jgi:pimeloyl-ACP methyl ester carboxylesterase
MNDLVVVIPGIFGSRLVRQKHGKSVRVWDLSLRTLPHTLVELATSDAVVQPSASDGITADGLISEPSWLPDFFGVDGYTTMVDHLQQRLGQRLLTFAYDWRKSNVTSAQQLADAAIPFLKDWRLQTGDDDCRLVLVCHSMGGLVARYFCEELGGAEYTRKIITFGTPHRGALKALSALVGPKRWGFFDASRLVSAWPSVWEMLPQYPCLLQADGGCAHLVDAGLPGLASPRFTAAQEFWARIRTPADARVAAKTEQPYEQQVFFGRVQTTPQYAKPDGNRVREISPGRDGLEDRGGDGTVPSFAAIPIEWDTTELALPLLDKHAALATRLSALEHLLNTLDAEDVSRDKGAAATPDDLDGPGLVLNVPAMVQHGDKVVVELITTSAPKVTVEVTDHQSGLTRPAFAEYTADGDRGYLLQADLGVLGPGTYTVKTLTLRPVSDHILVWSPVHATISPGALGDDEGIAADRDD